MYFCAPKKESNLINNTIEQSYTYTNHTATDITHGFLTNTKNNTMAKTQQTAKHYALD